MGAVSSRTLDLDGGTIAYLEAGAGEALVYLHGAGGRPPSGSTFVADLAESFRVLLPSRPGFDESPLGRFDTLTAVAEATAAFIEKTAGRPVHVVAQSAGGAVGLWLAVLYPELVASITLSAPSAFAHRPASPGPPAQRSPQDLDRLLYGDEPSWSSPPGDDELARIRRNAAFNMQHFAGHNDDLLPRLGEISAPVLLLWGTEDKLVPPDNSAVYQKQISHALRVFIHGAAHELPIAATQRWVGLVKDFIRRGEFFVVNAMGE